MEFYLYTCRHGDEKILMRASRKAWEFLLIEMERCDGITYEEAEKLGWASGSYVEGYLSIDDGGEIETIFLSEPERFEGK